MDFRSEEGGCDGTSVKLFFGYHGNGHNNWIGARTPANVSLEPLSNRISPESIDSLSGWNSLFRERGRRGFDHEVDLNPGEEEGGASPDPRDGRCDGGRDLGYSGKRAIS